MEEQKKELSSYIRKLDDEIRMLSFILATTLRFPDRHQDRSPNEIRSQIEKLKAVRSYLTKDADNQQK